MTDDLLPDDPLLRAVTALRQGERVPAGLAERTRRRARRQATVRRAAIAAGVTATIAAVVVIGPSDSTPPGQVTFALEAPTTSGVSLVGDFNDWDRDRVRLERVGGEWRVTLQLPPGRYRYSYVTDEGQWLSDPDAPPALDEFGAPTSVITIPSET